MNTDSVFPVGDDGYDAIYAEEAAMVDASELIAAALERSGISKTELARTLGVSKSEVSARLAGERNITVRTLAATLHALGTRLEFTVHDDVEQHDAYRRYSAWAAPAQGASRAPRDGVAVGAFHRTDWAQVKRAQ